MVEDRDPEPAGPPEWDPRPITLRDCRRRPKRRLALLCLKAAAAIVTLAIVAAGVLVVRMNAGPIEIAGLGSSITTALQDRFGKGMTFSIGGTSLVQRGFGPSLAIDGLTVKGPDGQPIVTAPKAEISVDMLALLIGRIVPKRLEVFDITIRAELMKSGTLAIAAADGSKPFVELGHGSDVADTPPSPAAPTGAAPTAPDPSASDSATIAPAAPRRAVVMRKAAVAIRQFLDILTDPSSPIAAVDRLGIARGKLVIEDQVNGAEVVYRNFDLDFDKRHGVSSFDVSADGPSRRWSVAALARGRPGGERRFALKVNDLSADELQLLAGTRSLGFDTDMRFALHLDLGLKANNDLSEASGGFKMGDGFVRLDDPDFEPTFITSIDGTFHWDGAARKIAVEPMHYLERDTHLTVAGTVTPPSNEGDPWRIALASTEPGVLGPDRKGQAPVAIPSVGFEGQLLLDQKRLLIDRMAFKAGTGGLALAGRVDWSEGLHLRLGAAMDPTPVPVVERVWPASVASGVRAWLLTHFEAGLIKDGTLKLDYTSEDLLRIRSDRAPRDESVAIDFKVEGGRVTYLDGVPPLDKLTGTGHVTGHTTHLVIESGSTTSQGQTIELSDGRLDVADSDIHPVDTRIAAHLSGSVEAVAHILSLDALKSFASLPLDASTLHGHVEGTLEKQLFLGGPDGPDGALSVHSTVDNFSAERLIGKEGLDDAKLAVDVESGTLKAVGQGRIFGGPSTFEIDRDGLAAPTAQIALTLDDAARAKLGFNAVQGVTGPMTAHVAATLGDPAKIKAQVEIDLAKTNVAAAVLGLNKPAGRPAKISFTIASGNDRMLLDPLTVDIATLQARGAVELGADNGFKAAHFPSLKVSTGDDMKLDVSKADDIFKLTIRGSTIDARPFLKALTSSPAGDPAALVRNAKAEKTDIEALKGFDVDMKSGILTGFNKEVMSGVDLRLSKRGDQISRFSVQGRFGRDPVTGSMSGNGRMKVQAQDAGALVSFIDLYKHMEGGQLAATMQVGADTLSGSLEIHDFVLRDEPAIRRLVATSTEVSAPGDDANAVRRIDGGAVDFKRLKVNFDRAGSRLELHDATMYGPQIGLSVDGWLDYSHDRVGMKGTFVPAFALNNIFAQIPVFGAVLGGKSNEGLLAITFNISGAASSPTLNINPLSAIAPGFLRNIFGVLDNPVPQPDGGGTALPFPGAPSR